MILLLLCIIRGNLVSTFIFPSYSLHNQFSLISVFGHYRDEDDMQHLFLRPNTSKDPFSKINRLKLIYLMLQAPKRQGPTATIETDIMSI